MLRMFRAACVRTPLAGTTAKFRSSLASNTARMHSNAVRTLTSSAAAAAHELNLPDVQAELMAVHERYEVALAENNVEELDTLFLNHDTTLRFGAADAQFGYDEIAAFRSGRPAPGPREILSTSVTTYGRDYGVANREFRRGTDPRIGRQSQTWIRTPDGWRVVSAHVSWLDSDAARLEQAAQRAEALMHEAADNLQGDGAIPCSGGREFPLRLSDTALYITDMQGDFLLPEGRIGQHYSSEDMGRLKPVVESTERLVAAARAAGLTIAYGRSHRYGAEIRRCAAASKLLCPDAPPFATTYLRHGLPSLPRLARAAI